VNDDDLILLKQNVSTCEPNVIHQCRTERFGCGPTHRTESDI